MCEISVILPCYNVAKFLPDCLQSLEKQTFKDFEMIFVDDGSTDNTPKVLDDFCAKHENAKVIRKHNGGVSSARNEGLKVAGGGFVYFMDPDDFIDPRTLEIAYNALKNSDAEVCRFKSLCVEESSNYNQAKWLTQKEIESAEVRIDEGREKILKDFFARRYGFAPWMSLFTHEMLKKLPNYPKIFDETWVCSEDFKINYDVYNQVEKVLVLPLKFYKYRIRNGSLGHSEWTEEKTKVFDFLLGEYEDVKTNYRKALVYLKSFMCDEAQRQLCKIARNGHCSEEKTKKIYKIYKAGLWSALIGVKNPYYTKLRFTELPYIWHCKNKIVRRARKSAKA